MPTPTTDLDVNLYISAQCPHCAQALELLTKAVKTTAISRLNITNLSSATLDDTTSHIRSVPHMQVQGFDFSGAITQNEINEWVSAHKENDFTKYYFLNLLTEGQLSKIEMILKQNPIYCIDILNIAKDDETKMQSRIGITAIFESIAKDIVSFTNINTIVEALISAVKSTQNAIRVDLIYLASLLYAEIEEQKKTNEVLYKFIHSLSNDDSDEVKEIVEDVL